MYPTVRDTAVAFLLCFNFAAAVPMNLVVASRHNDRHVRFDVEGRWANGDALKLAYMVKAAVARMRQDQVLIDLRRVAASPDAQGKFLICDRLRRALAPTIRVGLVAAEELVDDDGVPGGVTQCADIALFAAEPEAVRWLRGGLVRRAAREEEKVPRL
jgi:hypothetical protein